MLAQLKHIVSEIQRILIITLTTATIWDVQWLFQNYKHHPRCNIDSFHNKTILGALIVAYRAFITYSPLDQFKMFSSTKHRFPIYGEIWLFPAHITTRPNNYKPEDQKKPPENALIKRRPYTSVKLHTTIVGSNKEFYHVVKYTPLIIPKKSTMK